MLHDLFRMDRDCDGVVNFLLLELGQTGVW